MGTEGNYSRARANYLATPPNTERDLVGANVSRGRLHALPQCGRVAPSRGMSGGPEGSMRSLADLLTVLAFLVVLSPIEVPAQQVGLSPLALFGLEHYTSSTQSVLPA